MAIKEYKSILIIGGEKKDFDPIYNVKYFWALKMKGQELKTALALLMNKALYRSV